jgi:hypothetical protein
MSRSGAWRFAIPDLQRIILSGLPLTNEQLAILNEQEAYKALI